MKKENNSVKKKTYIAPNIVVVEIVMEQNIFAGSGVIPGMPGEPY